MNEGANVYLFGVVLFIFEIDKQIKASFGSSRSSGEISVFLSCIIMHEDISYYVWFPIHTIVTKLLWLSRLVSSER